MQVDVVDVDFIIDKLSLQQYPPSETVEVISHSNRSSENKRNTKAELVSARGI